MPMFLKITGIQSVAANFLDPLCHIMYTVIIYTNELIHVTRLDVKREYDFTPISESHLEVKTSVD